jgi:hypothetical protein
LPIILSKKTSAQNFSPKGVTMKKLMTVIMMLSLVLGGVSLAAAADVPQVNANLDLSKLQKISDQEAQQLRGTGMSFGAGTCLVSVTTPQGLYPKDYNYAPGQNLYPKNYNYLGTKWK